MAEFGPGRHDDLLTAALDVAARRAGESGWTARGVDPDSKVQGGLLFSAGNRPRGRREEFLDTLLHPPPPRNPSAAAASSPKDDSGSFCVQCTPAMMAVLPKLLRWTADDLERSQRDGRNGGKVVR